MSREPKFRAWDGEQYWYNVVPSPILSPTTDVCREGTGFEYYNEVDIIHAVEAIEQYTGMEDKNYVEIYEGDIVKGRYLSQQHLSYIPAMVIFDDTDLSYLLVIRGEKDALQFLNKYDVDNLEVIGNIHENSDLLEGEKFGDLK